MRGPGGRWGADIPCLVMLREVVLWRLEEALVEASIHRLLGMEVGTHHYLMGLCILVKMEHHDSQEVCIYLGVVVARSWESQEAHTP